MTPHNSRRRFLKQASTIALASSLMPKAGISGFFAEKGINGSRSTHPLQPIGYRDISIGGELLTRAMKNYDRLETDIYHPENVFDAGGASKGWPGDKEGRIILGLTLQAQATHREPKYLDEIIHAIPRHLNEKGYLGPVLEDKLLEQQLSGHGWFLRGLCEYYEWKKDPNVEKYIRDIISNLALPTRGYHKDYPIEPGSRRKDTGAPAGTTQGSVGRWMLSSDIGCDFIFIDGIVQAYSLFPSGELKSLIEEMIGRFLQIDLITVAAQTHATLTALRGILRYYELTGEPALIARAESSYMLYRTAAMTANYENYNWFGRPEWTEPCGIVDSFMLAVQLWQYTGNAIYLEDAHKIYYNALSHTQRDNGGFGLDNCPRPGTDTLKVYANEAYWCCTMRGGEGLAKAIQYSYFPGKTTLVVPFYRSSESSFIFDGKKVVISQVSNYPFENKVILTVLYAEGAPEVLVKLFSPSWMTNCRVTANGSPQPYKKDNGFIAFTIRLKKDLVIALHFDQGVGYNNTITYGPLLLGYEGDQAISFGETPQLIRQSATQWTVEDKDTVGDKAIVLSTVYHLMDPKVSKGSGYHKQILF